MPDAGDVPHPVIGRAMIALGHHIGIGMAAGVAIWALRLAHAALVRRRLGIERAEQIDHVTLDIALLERGRERAAAERLAVNFQEADAEALPFSDGSFDAALSTFGVMFTPDQEKAAAELARVVRRGGKVGLANWTPDGFIGQLLKLVGTYAPPPPGVRPPTLWGTAARLGELFPGHHINVSEQTFTFRYQSAEHWLDVFRSYYGPTNRAFAALDADKGAALEADILDLLEKSNWGGRDDLVVPSTYLEVVITTQ